MGEDSDPNPPHPSGDTLGGTPALKPYLPPPGEAQMRQKI